MYVYLPNCERDDVSFPVDVIVTVSECFVGPDAAQLTYAKIRAVLAVAVNKLPGMFPLSEKVIDMRIPPTVSIDGEYPLAQDLHGMFVG